MSAFNFDNVSSAAERIMTQPGTLGIFKISEVTFGVSKEKQSPFMELTFEDKDSSFKHPFYLSEKALPRIQSVIKAVMGKEVKGNINEEQLVVMLKGKEIALKVTGQVSNKGKGYPNLSFGGFCKPKGEVQFLEFNSKENDEIAAAKAAIARNSSAGDSEGTSSGSGAAPAATEAW